MSMFVDEEGVYIISINAMKEMEKRGENLVFLMEKANRFNAEYKDCATRESRPGRPLRSRDGREGQVQQYLEKHMLSRKIEDAVNAAVRAKTPVILIQSHHMRKSVPSVITKIKARQILDSRGIPTVEVDLFNNKGMFQASVPSGDTIGMCIGISTQ
uniref:Enolase N-terminal domain-containing protein n=1 Tax=Quercus lobata TaxID=97700 RepID=A0A7N2R8I9_QUELO